MGNGAFIERGRDCVRRLLESVILSPIAGTIQARVANGELAYTATLSGRDAKRLADKNYALNLLVRALADAYQDELPEGVRSDDIYVTMTTPSLRRRVRRTRSRVVVLADVLELPLGRLLKECGLLIKESTEPSLRPPLEDGDGARSSVRTKKRRGKKAPSAAT